MGFTRRQCLQGAVAALGLPAADAADLAMSAPSIQRRLRFALNFANPHERTLVGQKLWFYLPAGETATQRLLDVQVSMPHRVHVDRLDHRILQLSFEPFAPLAQRVVRVTADIGMNMQPRLEPLISASQWLIAERFVETDDPAVVALARQLRRADPLETTRAIYEWVAQNIQYAGYLADEFGASKALAERRGDCTEFASLSVALARACGLPARMLGGYVTDRDAAPKAADYHNWSEFHVDGAWRLVDCQKRRLMSPAQDYVTFRVATNAEMSPIGRAHRYRVEGEIVVTL